MTETQDFEKTGWEAAARLGSGRLSVAEKASIISQVLEITETSGHCGPPDFVSEATYAAFFEKIGVDGKVIADLGAGYSLRLHPWMTTHADVLFRSNVFFLPIDIQKLPAKSWLILDKEASDPVGLRLEPLVGNALQLPIRSDFLDGCIVTNLTNCTNPTPLHFAKLLFEEVRRVLRDDGFMLVSSFGYFHYQAGDGRTFFNNDTPDSQVVEVDALEHLALLSGFRRLERLPLDSRAMDEAILNNYAYYEEVGDPMAEITIVGAGAFVAQI